MALTARVLRIVAFSEPFFGLSIVMSGALRGARDVAFPMGVALGCMWGVRATIAPLLIFGFHWGLEAVWLGFGSDLPGRIVRPALAQRPVDPPGRPYGISGFPLIFLRPSDRMEPS